jgi:hypothetical protein
VFLNCEAGHKNKLNSLNHAGLRISPPAETIKFAGLTWLMLVTLPGPDGFRIAGAVTDPMKALQLMALVEQALALLLAAMRPHARLVRSALVPVIFVNRAAFLCILEATVAPDVSMLA